MITMDGSTSHNSKPIVVMLNGQTRNDSIGQTTWLFSPEGFIQLLDNSFLPLLMTADLSGSTPTRRLLIVKRHQSYHDGRPPAVASLLRKGYSGIAERLCSKGLFKLYHRNSDRTIGQHSHGDRKIGQHRHGHEGWQWANKGLFWGSSLTIISFFVPALRIMQPSACNRSEAAHYISRCHQWYHNQICRTFLRLQFPTFKDCHRFC